MSWQAGQIPYVISRLSAGGSARNAGTQSQMFVPDTLRLVRRQLEHIIMRPFDCRYAVSDSPHEVLWCACSTSSELRTNREPYLCIGMTSNLNSRYTFADEHSYRCSHG